MRGLFEILEYSIGCLFWGVLITILSYVFFVFLIRGWYRDAAFTLSSYLVGILLFFPICFQCTLTVGALRIIDTTDGFEQRVREITSQCFPSDEEVGIREANEVLQVVIGEQPLLRHYIGGGEFSGYTAGQLPEVMADTLRTYMRWYIVRRLGWCLAFIVMGAVLAIKTLSKGNVRRRSGVPASRRDAGRVPVSRRKRIHVKH